MKTANNLLPSQGAWTGVRYESVSSQSTRWGARMYPTAILASCLHRYIYNARSESSAFSKQFPNCPSVPNVPFVPNVPNSPLVPNVTGAHQGHLENVAANGPYSPVWTCAPTYADRASRVPPFLPIVQPSIQSTPSIQPVTSFQREQSI